MDWRSLYKHTKTFLKNIKREVLKPEIHESFLSDIQTGGSKKNIKYKNIKSKNIKYKNIKYKHIKYKKTKTCKKRIKSKTRKKKR